MILSHYIMILSHSILIFSILHVKILLIFEKSLFPFYFTCKNIINFCTLVISFLFYRTVPWLESHGFVTVVTDFHNISRENYVTTCDKVWHLKNKKIGFSVTFCVTLWHLKYFNFAFAIENKLKFQIIELFSFWNWHTPRKQK